MENKECIRKAGKVFFFCGKRRKNRDGKKGEGSGKMRVLRKGEVSE